MKKIISLTIFILLSQVLTFSQFVNTNTENVIVVFKTHFDIGYTDYAASVIKKYQTSMIEGALDRIDDNLSDNPNGGFSWTMPAWPMKKILEGATEETRSRTIKALQDGTIAIHALPFTIETEASDLESMTRMFRYSNELSELYDLELPRDAKMTDVPEHSWFLPTVLHNAGVDFLHLGCNPASMSPDVPVLFWWEGPDGSRLMTMYWQAYYGTDVFTPEDWDYKTWMALIPTNDNKGAPSPEEIEKILSDIRKYNPKAKIQIGRMSDFYDMIIEEEPVLPVIKADMPDTWIHGYMSAPKETALSRKLKRDLYSLEMLDSQFKLWTGSGNTISNDLLDAEENIHLFDEHTFGLAMSHGHSGSWLYGNEFKDKKAIGVYSPIELSWKEKGMRISEAELDITPHYNYAISELASSVNVAGSHIVVYNPLPWERSGIVKIQVGSGSLNSNRLTDPEGNLIPVSNRGNVIRFRAENVPPMGYKTYIPVKPVEDNPGPASSKISNSIENDYLRITIDPIRGGIKSFYDLTEDKELVANDPEYPFGTYIYERFSKDNTDKYAKAYIKAGWHWANDELGRPGLDTSSYKQIIPSPSSVEYSNDIISSSVTLRFDPENEFMSHITLIYTLYKNSPYLEIKWGIIGKDPEPWPEAGWISFNADIENPQFRVGRLGGIVNPKNDFINRSNHDYYFYNSAVSIIDNEGNGLAITSPDVPAISLDRPGLWKYSSEFIPQRPNIFFNLFNNQWSTNFTEWIEGSWNTTFFVWPVHSYSNESSIITPSEELKMPFKAAFSQSSTMDLPVSGKGIELSMKGVVLTSFGAYQDNNSWRLRIWEQSGGKGECIITLPVEISSNQYYYTNLRGEVISELFNIIDNKISIDIEPYKPYTIVLK